MSRGGFFAGGDYVCYTPGPLAYATPTSAKEFRKQKTVICSNCKREVPQKVKCIFCDNILR